MAKFILLLALPATLLSMIEANPFFRGFGPMPFPMMPFVHPFSLMPFHPFMPIRPPLMPPSPRPRTTRPAPRTRTTNTRSTTSQIQRAPIAQPMNRQSDVIVVINDRDCYGGYCGGMGGGMGGGGGFVDRMGVIGGGQMAGPMMNSRSSYSVNDADHVVIGGTLARAPRF